MYVKFVGGPMDGRKLLVAEGVTSLVVDYHVSGVRAQYRRHLHTVRDESEHSSAIFVLGTMSRDEAIAALRLALDRGNEAPD